MGLLLCRIHLPPGITAHGKGRLDVISQNVRAVASSIQMGISPRPSRKSKAGSRERGEHRLLGLCLPSGWKPEVRIKEASPLSTDDVTVIPVTKLQSGVFANLSPSSRRLLRNLRLPAPKGSSIARQHFCFQGHNKMESSTFSATACGC